MLVEQFNMKKGINIFGSRAETEVTKELQKIHDMNTYTPINESTLTYQKIKYSLDFILFITEKRNGDIKARKVAVGSKKINYDGYDNINDPSPTVNTDSVFLMGVIYAHQCRAVAMLDTKNYFLHAENYKCVLMLPRGKLKELLVKVYSKWYQKYMITSKQGVPMLYVKLTKALYEILQRAMLLYKSLRSHLKEIGFKINPYDPCVDNMIINIPQMTVYWHVDGLKISPK